MLLEGSKLTKDDRESQLYDDFEHFRQKQGETIHEYYVRFSKLINDMRNIKMTMPKMQLNSKFVNNMLLEWGRFVTEVKLNRGLKTSNYDQLYAYLKQHEVHANETLRDRMFKPSLLTIIVETSKETVSESHSASEKTQVVQLSSATLAVLSTQPACQSSLPATAQQIKLMTSVKIAGLVLANEKVELMKDSPFKSLASFTHIRESSALYVQALCRLYDASERLCYLNEHTPFSFCSKEVARVLEMEDTGLDYNEYEKECGKYSKAFPGFIVDLQTEVPGVSLSLRITDIVTILKGMNVDSEERKTQFKQLMTYYLIEKFLKCSRNPAFGRGSKKILEHPVKMLLEGSKLTKDDRESQLYDDFEHFRQKQGETIHEYYVRFSKLINDMRNIKMTMPKMQLDSKFVNNMLLEWGRFVTEVKLNRGLKTSNYDQLYAYLKQHEVHANETLRDRMFKPSLLTIIVETSKVATVVASDTNSSNYSSDTSSDHE
ncbi:hypothetical protein Tco_1188262 [Tanacetum coccineum]